MSNMFLTLLKRNIFKSLEIRFINGLQVRPCHYLIFELTELTLPSMFVRDNYIAYVQSFTLRINRLINCRIMIFGECSRNGSHTYLNQSFPSFCSTIHYI